MYAVDDTLAFGPVCDVGFGFQEALVVCKDQGFKKALFMAYGSFFGPVKGHFAMTGLTCNELMTGLPDCNWSSNEAYCHSKAGAGVVCKA